MKMGYWIFQDEQTGLCTAINDGCLSAVRISDDLGELLHDGPMPLMIAKMYVAKRGGRIVEGADADTMITRSVAAL